MVELRERAARGDFIAREVAGGERQTWWTRAVEVWPDYAEHQTRTEREIRVFVLEPVK